MKELLKPLQSDEIECRIANVSVGKGFSVLLYKTARTDVNRLNEAFGILWSNRYFYDSKNLLCCGISIYDKDTSQWIERVDVGVESFTEKEKGSYSDAMKRAGFKWGIGIELYKAPFIWINCNKWKKVKDKEVPDVRVSDWKIIFKKDSLLDGFSIVDGNGLVVWDNKSRIESKSEEIKGEVEKFSVLNKLKMELKKRGAEDVDSALKLLSLLTGNGYTSLELTEQQSQEALADIIRNNKA